MAREGRNVIAILFKNIIDSLKPRKFRGDLMGKDYLGNKYFEITGATKRTTRRWFEPPGGEKDFDNEMPAEWESWLRGRRNQPPTQEEIEANVKMMKTKEEKGRALEADSKSHEKPTISSDKVPFPKLEGYEIYPGKKS